MVLAPGEQKEMSGRSADEAIASIALQAADVAVLVELEGSDRAAIVCDMKDPGDVSGGGTTLAACGFDLETQAGAAANVAPQMYLGVFDDATCQTPAENATLDTAATGTIDAGAGTNLLTVTPAATGEVSVTLTDAEDETVYLKAWAVGTDYIVDSSDIDDVTFSA